MKTLRLLPLVLAALFLAAPLAPPLHAQGRPPVAWMQAASSLQVLSVSLSPDGSQLATTDAYAVKIWRAADGTLLRTLRAPYGHVSATYSPDGQWLAVVSQGSNGYSGTNVAYIYNAADLSLAASLIYPSSALYPGRFSSDSRTFMIEGPTAYWRTSDWTLIGSHSMGVAFLTPDLQSVLGNGTQTGTGFGPGYFSVYDAANYAMRSPAPFTRTPITDFGINGGPVRVFTPDSRDFVKYVGAGKLHRINISDGTTNHTYTAIGSFTASTGAYCYFSPNGGLLFGAFGTGGTGLTPWLLEVWDAASSALISTFNIPHFNLRAFAPAGNNQSVFIGTTYGEVLQYGLDGTLIRRFSQITDTLNVIASSPDGRFVASGASVIYLGPPTRIFRATDGALLGSLNDLTNGVISVDFSADSSLLAALDSIGNLAVWQGAHDGIVPRGVHAAKVSALVFGECSV